MSKFVLLVITPFLLVSPYSSSLVSSLKIIQIIIMFYTAYDGLVMEGLRAPNVLIHWTHFMFLCLRALLYDVVFSTRQRHFVQVLTMVYHFLCGTYIRFSRHPSFRSSPAVMARPVLDAQRCTKFARLFSTPLYDLAFSDFDKLSLPARPD